jgi:CheY-like chemotaxis protein
MVEYTGSTLQGGEMLGTGDVQILRVLAVEDDERFLELLQHAMDVLEERFELTVARDGLEALEILQRTGEQGHRARPHIVLIDLKTPRMDGKELLSEMKNSEELKSIPAIVMSDSENPWDVDECYKLQADSFITKPCSFQGIVDSLRQVHAFWHKTCADPAPLDEN